MILFAVFLFRSKYLLSVMTCNLETVDDAVSPRNDFVAKQLRNFVFEAWVIARPPKNDYSQGWQFTLTSSNLHFKSSNPLNAFKNSFLP